MGLAADRYQRVSWRWRSRWASPPACSACWRRMRLFTAATGQKALLGSRDADGDELSPFPHRPYPWPSPLGGHSRDSATARLGEGFYHFLLRTVAGQFLEAWRFRTPPPWHARASLRRSRHDGSRLRAIIVFAIGPRALSVLPGAKRGGDHRAGTVQLHRALWTDARSRRRGQASAASRTGTAGTPAMCWPTR